MFKKINNDNEQNFWIAYADLMAGLLFVFILLIGAIVIKYVLTQSDLTSITSNLKFVKSELEKTKNILKEKEKIIVRFSNKISICEDDNLRLSGLNNELISKNDELISNYGELTSKVDKMDEEYKFLSDMLKEANVIISVNESELMNLTKMLESEKLIHEKLIQDLNITKNQIKNLTGIRINVIHELKKKFGNKISIDSKSGSIVLPSSVLFDRNSYVIKPEAEDDLENALMMYFDVLIGNEEIRNNIDKILIEGHTDSDGSYMYNLDLSQKRAYAIMSFIYSMHRKDTEILKNYLTVSGRSYNDLIMKDGVEDKEASRRIEIKFNIANKKAIEEIEKFLESEVR